MSTSNATQPYNKRGVPTDAGELPGWLPTELGLIQRAIPNYGRVVIFTAAAPTTGTWAKGDLAFNNLPAAGGFIGWVCTTAGSPGTWKTWGAISA